MASSYLWAFGSGLRPTFKDGIEDFGLGPSFVHNISPWPPPIFGLWALGLGPSFKGGIKDFGLGPTFVHNISPWPPPIFELLDLGLGPPLKMELKILGLAQPSCITSAHGLLLSLSFWIWA
ncbi:hypothetical protein SDJN03_03362, partial [Cucurbita argyrosperma subsp. sororia]